MRPVPREPLDERAADALAAGRRALSDDPLLEAGATWESRRRSLEAAGVVATLRRMAGAAGRCMYCCDSRATDVEHFRPKSAPAWRAWVFAWENLLLACGACRRQKGSRLPVDADGRILLVDPTAVDPWRHLVYDETSGLLTARWYPDGSEDPAGLATVDPRLLPLNVEAIARGRRRAWHRLADAVRHGEGPLDAAFDEAEEWGLATWVLRWEGARCEPFDAWRRANAAEACRLAARLPKLAGDLAPPGL